MGKTKKILAAMLAIACACSMMTACGDETSDSGDTGASTITAAAGDAAEDAGDAAAEGDEADAEAEAEAEAEDAAEDEEFGESLYAPDLNYKHTYEFDGYDAFLMYADSEWFWRNMNHEGNVHSEGFDPTDAGSYGYGVDADITGDGEYTVKLTKDSIYSNNGYLNEGAMVDEDTGDIFPSNGATVFCVDIVGLMDGSETSGLNDDGEWVIEEADPDLEDGDNHYNADATGDYKVSDLTVELVSIKADGKDVPFDPDKIRYGNIEDNNNRYRIEIYNAYGTTAQDCPICDGNPLGITWNESLEVTFTISGLGDIKDFPEVEPFAAEATAAE